MTETIIQPQIGRVRVLSIPAYVPPTDSEFIVVGGSAGTQPTFDGDPLFSGHYLKVGQLVHFSIDVDFSNITSFGTGQYYVELPFTSKFRYQFGSGCLHDSTQYPIFGAVEAGEKKLDLWSMDTQGNTAFNVPFTSTAPKTLTTADSFHISGVYITSE